MRVSCCQSCDPRFPLLENAGLFYFILIQLYLQFNLNGKSKEKTPLENEQT
jgi:hypothetical protein